MGCEASSIFIIECGIARFLCAVRALCVYSMFGHYPNPIVYPCVIFCFCRALHCWASPWRKISYSINHWPSLFDVSGTEAFTSEYVFL